MTPNQQAENNNELRDEQQRLSANEVDVSLQARQESSLPTNGPPVIMIEEGVVAAAAEHGQQDTSREQGGVLVGTVAAGDQETVVCVEAAIPAVRTRASRSQVTFTHDSWNQIYQVIDSQYPDKQIVGWYHTHPGFGIFLSEYDLFIHRHFFSAPWQVAYVIDPLSGESGCFSWQGKKIIPTADYNIFRPGATAPLPVLPTAAVGRPTQLPGPAGLQPVSLVMLVVLGLILALQVTNLLVSGRRPAPSMIADSVLAEARSVEPIRKQRAGEEISLDEISEELRQLRAELGMYYQWYTVNPGDSLWKIAENTYGRGDMAGLIAAENGLDPADPLLEPGMKLRLPKLPEKTDEAAKL